MAQVEQNVYLEPGKLYQIKASLVLNGTSTAKITYPKQDISNPENNYSEYDSIRVEEVFSDVFTATDYGKVILSSETGSVSFKDLSIYDVSKIEKIEDYVNGDKVPVVDRDNQGDRSLSPMGFPSDDFLDSSLFLEGNWNNYTEYFLDDMLRYGFSHVDADGNTEYDVAFYKCTTVNTNELPVLLVRDEGSNANVSIELSTSDIIFASDKIDVGREVPAGIGLTFTNAGGSLPDGIIEDFEYFAVNVSGNEIQLATEVGGSAIALGSAGTGTHSISFNDTVNTAYWKKFVSFTPDFHTTYADGHGGRWLPTTSYSIGDRIIYPYGESTEVYYFISKTNSNLNNVPSDNSTPSSPVIDAVNWEQVTHCRPSSIDDESNDRLTGDDYVFDGDEYLNVEAHRQRDYTDEQVVDFINARLSQENDFGQGAGTFFNWLDVSGSHRNVDLTSSSSVSTRVDTFGASAGAKKVRRFGPQDGNMNLVDLNRQRMYTRWGIGTNTSSDAQENGNGDKSAFLKNYPTEYNGTADSQGGHVANVFDGTNETKTLDFDIELNTSAINSNALKIFDITRVFDYKNKWHNNITLDLDYSKYEFIIAGFNKVRVEGIDVTSKFPTERVIDITMDAGATFERLEIINSTFDGTDTVLTFDRNLSRVTTEEPPIDEFDADTNVSIASDTFTLTGTNRIADDIAVIFTGDGVANIDNIDDTTLYYVIETTGTPSTFKIALTTDGAAIDLVENAAGLSGGIEVHKIKPSTGSIMTGMVGRHHIAINHDLTSSSNDDFVELENSLDELVEQNILRSEMSGDAIKYYFKPLSGESLTTSVNANDVTYEYTDGGDTYSYIISHASASGASIRAFMDNELQTIPIPIDVSDDTDDLQVLYIANVNATFPKLASITGAEINAGADTIDIGVTPPSAGTAIVFSEVNGFEIASVAVDAETVYYVYNVSGTTFQLVSSPTSTSALDITDSGSGDVTVNGRIDLEFLNDGTNNELTHSKKTFIHLPADNIKDGQELDLTISLPAEDYSSYKWSNNIGGVISYKNFISQPRAYVFSGKESCDGEEELHVYSDRFELLNGDFWSDAGSANSANNDYDNGELTNTTELTFPDSASIPTIMARSSATAPILGEWAELIGVKLNIDLNEHMIDYSTLSLSPSTDVIAQYQLGNLLGEVYLAVSNVTDHAKFDVFFRINGDNSTDTVLGSYDTNTEFVGRKEVDFVYKVEKDGTGTKHTLTVSGQSSTTEYTIATGGNDGGTIAVSNCIFNVENVSNDVLFTVTPVVKCFSVRTSDPFTGEMPELTEEDNQYLYSEFPEIEFATHTTVFNQSIMDNDNIESDDKRVLLATVYPTSLNTFGLRMREIPSARLVYWNILSTSAFVGGPSHRAYETLRRAAQIGDADQNFPTNYLDIDEFAVTLANHAAPGPGSFINGVWQGTKFTYGALESARPLLPINMKPSDNDIASDPYFDATNESITSYVSQANRAHHELLKFFMKGTIVSEDIVDNSGDPIIGTLDDYGISRRLPYNFLTVQNIFDHGSITITESEVSINPTNTIDLSVDSYTAGHPIQFSTVNGIEFDSVAVTTDTVYYVYNPIGTVVQLVTSPDSTTPVTITSAGSGNIVVEPMNRYFTKSDTVNNENRSLKSWLRKPVHIPENALANDPVFQLGALSNTMLESGDASINHEKIIEEYETYNTSLENYYVNINSIIGTDLTIDDIKNPDPFNVRELGIFKKFENINSSNYKLLSEMWNALYTTNIMEEIQSASISDPSNDYYNSLEYTMRAMTNMISMGGMIYPYDMDTTDLPVANEYYDPIANGGFSSSVDHNDPNYEALYDTFANSISPDPIAKYFYDAGTAYTSIYSASLDVSTQEQYRADFLKKYITPFSNKLPLRFYDSMRMIAKGDENSSSPQLQGPKFSLFVNGILASLDSSVVATLGYDFIGADFLSYIESPEVIYELTDPNASSIDYSIYSPNDPFDAVKVALDISVPGRMVSPQFAHAKQAKSYIRVDMRFIYSKESGRWLTLNYKQSPTTYLSPAFGAKAISHTEKSFKVFGAEGTSAEDFVGQGYTVESTLVSGSDVLTGTSGSFDDIAVGMTVYGSGIGSIADDIKVVELLSDNSIKISSDATSNGSSTLTFIMKDFVWIPNANYTIDPMDRSVSERNSWKTIPYYRMVNMELNKYCIPFISDINYVTGNTNMIDDSHTSLDDIKVTGTQSVFRIWKLSHPTSLELGSPSDVHGTPINKMVGGALAWKMFWNIRPCSTGHYGTDIPSTTGRTGGVLSDPAMANMFDYPNMDDLEYRVPYHRMVDKNWLEFSDSNFLPVYLVSIPSTLSLSLGDTSQLIPTFSDGNQYVGTWASNDESIATVDADGNVTADAANLGDVVISFTYDGITRYCTVTVAELPFIMTVEVPSDTYTMTLQDIGTAENTIEWGDTQSDTTTNNDVAHEYATSGTYEVKIFGEISRGTVSTSIVDEPAIITSVDQWGDNLGTNIRYLFRNATSLSSIPSTWVGFENTTDAQYLFDGCTSLATIPSSWTGMDSMIAAARMFRATPITALPTSWSGIGTVGSLEGICENCTSLVTIPSEWTQLTNLTNSSSMFRGCSSLVDIPNSWSGLDNVSSTYFMFHGCSSIVDLPSSWSGLGNVFQSGYMFGSCSSLVNIPSSWSGLDSLSNTSTNSALSGGMFSGCSSLVNIPSTWEGLENMQRAWYMFANCPSLSAIPSDWTGLDSITHAESMFSNCTSLTTMPNTWTGFENVISTKNMFYSCSSLTNMPTTWAGCGLVSDAEQMYRGCTALAAIPSTWSGLSSLENAKYMFRECSTVSAIPSASTAWADLSAITNVWGMFRECPLVTTIPSTWTGLEAVTSAREMFAFCGLTAIPSAWTGLELVDNGYLMFSNCDLTNIPTSWVGLGSIGGSEQMFSGNSNLASIPSSWTGLTSLDSMGSMFADCDSLTAIPSSWSGLPSLTRMNGAFLSCDNLATIPTSWAGLENVTNIASAFSGCGSLSAIPSTFAGLESVTIASYAFDGCSTLTSVPTDWTALANVTDTSRMLRNCTGLTSDILTPYTYMSGKAIPVTAFTDTFSGCTSASGYASVPSAWGGGGA